jgi:hypothetical protein
MSNQHTVSSLLHTVLRTVQADMFTCDGASVLDISSHHQLPGPVSQLDTVANIRTTYKGHTHSTVEYCLPFRLIYSPAVALGSLL